MQTRFLKNLFSDGEAGNVTIELALIMSVFIIVILLGVDFSRMAIEKHRLEQFARAGTQYGLLGQSEAQDLPEVINAVNAAAGADSGDITVTASNFCECDGGSSDCDDTCADDTVPELYLSVNVVRTYDYMFTLGSDLAGTITLAGDSTVRVR